MSDPSKPGISSAGAALSERQRRAHQVFEAAIALEPSQRAGYVAGACRGDFELRRDVEILLETAKRKSGGDFQVGQQTGRVSEKTAALSTAEIALAEAGPAVPQRLHNYNVGEKIGEGGMGQVFMARHHFFDRQAALKVLHPHLCADETLVQRFLNEARAANAIRHPNIIEVIDAGLLPESTTPYLLMEYLRGESVSARMQKGRLTLEAALQIAGQTASALAAAHDQGIIHRDLKPENLFLVPRAGGDLVKVLDFGIAKLRPEMGGTNVKTQLGSVVGTPRYMSPEQCMGTGIIDHRSDIYSLGVILFEMLCGQPPFEAEGVGGLLAAHILNPPPPPRMLNPDLPAEIEQAVLRALRKEPAQRFATMRELRAALGPHAVPRVAPQSSEMTVHDGSGAIAASWTAQNQLPGRKATPDTNSTLNSSATELGAVPARGRRPLVAIAAGVAVLGLGAGWYLAGPGTSPPAIPATVVEERKATPPPKPAEVKPVAELPARPAVQPPPPPEPSMLAVQRRSAVIPDAGAASRPEPRVAPPPRKRPAAGTPLPPPTPAKPKDFEPPLW